MSNSTRIAERQRTDTSAPVPVDLARDILAVVRALNERVTELEALVELALRPVHLIDLQPPVDPSDALSAALRLPTVPDAYGR